MTDRRCCSTENLIDSTHVLGSRGGLTGDNLVRYLSALHEHSESATLQGGYAREADEKILAPVIGGYVTFARLVAELFDRSDVRFRHHYSKPSFHIFLFSRSLAGSIRQPSRHILFYFVYQNSSIKVL